MKGRTDTRKRKGKQYRPYWRWNEKKRRWEHPKYQEHGDEIGFFRRFFSFIFGLYVPSTISASIGDKDVDYYVWSIGDCYARFIGDVAKKVVIKNNNSKKEYGSMANLPTNRKPGEKYASSLRAGMRVWMDGKPVKLTDVVNEPSGGGLGLTRLYWDGGKSDGVCNRIVLLAPDDLDDFVQDLDMSGL